MILFALLVGTTALGAHATTSIHHANLSGRPGKNLKTTTSPRNTMPFSCTIALSGSLSAGFGTITATCSATESTCDLAQYAASSCLTSVLKSLRNQLK